MAEQEIKSLSELWKDIGPTIQVLGIAGVCGALFKAVLAPEEQWKRRAAQGIAGVFSAVFLGFMISRFIPGFENERVYVIMASGFVCGAGGEAVMAFVQRKFLGSK